MHFTFVRGIESWNRSHRTASRKEHLWRVLSWFTGEWIFRWYGHQRKATTHLKVIIKAETTGMWEESSQTYRVQFCWFKGSSIPLFRNNYSSLSVISEDDWMRYVPDSDRTNEKRSEQHIFKWYYHKRKWTCSCSNALLIKIIRRY